MTTVSFRAPGQRGVALVVVLILLVVMTLLALAAMRGSILQERMSANEYDRSMGFQAAEAALREAEVIAKDKPKPTGAGCTDGVCSTPEPTDAPRWELDDAAWNAISKEVSVWAPNAAEPLAGKPRFIIELMATDAKSANCTTSGDVSPDAACSETEYRYRITARSRAQGRADVILQTMYAAP